MDGSHHDWLEGRGPKFVLMGWIDDAEGKVFGRFYEYEGALSPAMDSFKRYNMDYGLPMSGFVDRMRPINRRGSRHHRASLKEII